MSSETSPSPKKESTDSPQQGSNIMGTFGVITSLLALAAGLYFTAAKSDVASIPSKLPPQTVFVDPRSFAVLGQNGPFRSNSFSQFLNPTNTTPPFFQAFDPAFLDIIGESPSLRIIASNPGFAFAHEAPVYDPDTDEVFFASNDGGPLGFSDINHNNQVSKLSLKEAEAAAQASGSTSSPLNVTVTKLNLPETIQMTNGGTGPFHGNLILINSGRGALPPSIALVNPRPPNNATVLLDNFFGRQFNSLNDIKIHPTSQKLFFTDVTYGFLNHFRPLPQLPNQVYQFDPATGVVRVVADGFDRPNGIAFTKDGNTAYVSDTGATAGFLGNNQTEPATIYAFDVDPKSQTFTNRRVFAYVDAGIADGINVDTNGNVYGATSDGAHVWDSTGKLIGKFFLGTLSANLQFAGKGRLVILAETSIALAHIAAEGVKVNFP